MLMFFKSLLIPTIIISINLIASIGLATPRQTILETKLINLEELLNNQSTLIANLQQQVQDHKDALQKGVQVIHVEHTSGYVGRYFHFMAADLDKVLGRDDWNASPINVKNLRTGTVHEVFLWRAVNTGLGDAHGRIHPFSASANGDWEAEDVFIIQ